MVAGLEITNDTGKVQITSDYSNVVLKSKFRKTSTNPITNDGLFFAIQPDIGQDVEPYMYDPNTQINANLCTPYGDAGTSLGNMTVYTFDIANSANLTSLEKLGLEVFRSDGTVAYNSNLKYLRVLDSSKNYIGQGKYITDEIPGVSFHDGYERTLNFGHANVAVIFNTAYHTVVADWEGTYNLVSACRLKPNFDLIISDFTGVNRNGFEPPYSTECNWLVIDTTGY